MSAVPTALTTGLAVLLGLAVGSFLNVVVHRVPHGLSVVSPGSACPACGHEVRGRDNVPVVSWLLLHGRCRDCQTPISVRYPLVEAATGALFGVMAWRVQQPALLGAVLVLSAAGTALTLIDLEHGRLPFAITGWTAILAAPCVVAAVALGAASGRDVLISVALWLAVYGGLWLASRGRAMGLGDVALAPVLGLVLGAIGLDAGLVGLGLGFLLGGIVGVALVAARRAGRGSAVPHGPFMLTGAGVAVLAGAPLATAYLAVSGLA